MNGMSAHEFLHATVMADIFHWLTIGAVALCAWLITRWMKRRAIRSALGKEQYPGEFGPLPPGGDYSGEPSCVCPTCGRGHFPMPTDMEQRQYIAMVEATGGVPTIHDFGPLRPLNGPRKPRGV